MARTYTIYHAPGQRKVGCTVDFKQRTKQYRDEGYDGPIEVLEIFTGDPKDAGDLEWAWADRFGYNREQHYATNNWSAKLTPEQRSGAGKKGGKIGGKVATEKQKQTGTGLYDPAVREMGRRRIAELRETGELTINKSRLSHGGKIGGRTAATKPDFVNKQVWRCVTHGKTMNLGQIKNHHSRPECVVERVK